MTAVTLAPPGAAPSRADAVGIARGVRRRPCRALLRGRMALLGPAFVAAVAYVDPGNVATNVSAGSGYGYLLVWVVVAANAMAVLVQYLSAKAGLATGRNLPELCREMFGPRVSVLLWAQAELVAMATDLAEFVGAALGLNLLFGVPLLPAGLVTAVVSFGLLAGQQRRRRRFELAVTALLALVAAGFGYDLLAVGHPDPGHAAAGLLPSLHGPASLTLAIGIVGATVMPHVVYLHSSLTQERRGDRLATDGRSEADDRRRLRFLRLDCGLGLGLAGLVNLAMLAMAAALFHRTGHTGVTSIEAAHAGLARMAGGGAALAFAVALLASGLSSSSVGTFAGQVVMQGFLRRHVPVLTRRALTMTPALLVLAAGLPTSQTLVLSQVALSFGIPFALVPLVLVTRRHDLMGALVNRRATTVAAAGVAALVVGLNAYLVAAALR